MCLIFGVCDDTTGRVIDTLAGLDGYGKLEEGHSATPHWTPIGLAKQFDASLYSSIRQYVSKSDRCCVVLILNPLQLLEHFGFKATLRRVVSSSKFATMFDNSRWPQTYTPDDRIGRMVPLGKRRSSGKQELSLTDANGDRHDCIVESFTQKHQVFILIHVTETLGRSKITLPVS